ncbi:MAG: hypothetical protein RIE24_09790 [Silicimonas sp.]|jgi:uncharacterized protein (TIGR00725 family)|uniref:SLOG cluster 4 domain-containing protein n=1 Tax=Roseitalea porphyridii TaxID=1852022 RepID=UPI0032ED1280
MPPLVYESTTKTLWRRPARRFDAWDWAWRDDPSLRADRSRFDAMEPLEPLAALRHVLASGSARLLPVGVIGPREASTDEATLAEALGLALAELGFPVLCGGKSGVMEAVCKGVARGDGLSIGLLPDEDWRAGNAHVAMPLATGIGRARNVVIAHAAIALIAVGGRYGTMTEAAFGLHFDKPVIGLGDAPDLPDLKRVADVDAAIKTLAETLLIDAALS